MGFLPPLFLHLFLEMLTMLDGFRISGYRSFGEDSAVIPDLERVNVFIGKNNCGKSNVLRFVSILSAFLKKYGTGDARPKLDPMLDFAKGTKSHEVTYSLQIKNAGFTDEVFQSISEPFGREWTNVFSDNPDSLWFTFHLARDNKPTAESIQLMATRILQSCNDRFQQELTSVLCGYTQGSAKKRVEDIAIALHKKVQLDLNVHTINAFRRISNDDSDGGLMSGSGLIRELRNLQSPQLADYDSGKARFSRIVGFLRSILGEQEAKLEIPAEKDEIYVTLNGKVLPIDSLGTGIHELIIMATAVTLVDGQIFCVEEPEIHLHPELQKKFVEYIKVNTNNQYLIASHSNSFFDLPGVNIYRCCLEDGFTNCDLVSEAKEKHELLRDLGYRPSDLLQANYVIWVEGPSDRVYLRHWIHTKAPELTEGLHYTIMFYGGRLLAHLSYDDSEVEDFVNLACLNRRACIVMDSDKENVHSKINKTKQRVKGDFEKNCCMTWVTNGRTIENYIPENFFNESVARIHPRTKKIFKWGRFDDLTHLRSDKIIDKVAVAKAIAEDRPDFSMLNLSVVLDRLVGEIRRSNSNE